MKIQGRSLSSDLSPLTVASSIEAVHTLAGFGQRRRRYPLQAAVIVGVLRHRNVIDTEVLKLPRSC